MRKKTLLLLLALFVAVLAISSLFVWTQLNPPYSYQKNISRSVDNQEEENVFATAESLNYTKITSSKRFDGSSDTEAYLNPGTYQASTYANFIDSEAINYYETRYSNLEEKTGLKYPKGIELSYEANVTKYTEFRIFNSPAPEGVTWHNTTVVFSVDDSVLRKDVAAMQFFYKNQSSYQLIEWEYDLNFSNCYIVEMKLNYYEYYGPLSSFYSNVYQIVVFEEDSVPVLVGIHLFHAVS